MKQKTIAIWIALCIAMIPFFFGPPDVMAEEVFITIGSGDVSGVYYPAGLAIAKIINNKRQQYGIRAAVEATAGTKFNLNAVMAGYMEFALVQSDNQFQAVNGLADWADMGPQKDLRAMFSLHHETVTLVTAVDANIDSIADLRGKRVSIGNPGPKEQRIIISALKAFDLDPHKDILPFRVMASDAPALLQDRGIDAFFFTVGHPNETIRKALSGERKTRIISISGPAIDSLVARNIPYVQANIPVKALYPDVDDQADVTSFGVIATLCTSSRVPEDVVYALTKEVFENLDMFRRQHPAFHDLNKEGMLEGLSAPMHPGALRYFKAAGLTK